MQVLQDSTTFHYPNVRGPTKVEVEHHVASGHAQNRTWCDACKRARGIAGRHERRVPGREDEDPLVAIDCGFLKLDGTEDDEDDDDETTQNKLLILVAHFFAIVVSLLSTVLQHFFNNFASSF